MLKKVEKVKSGNTASGRFSPLLVLLALPESGHQQTQQRHFLVHTSTLPDILGRREAENKELIC